MRITELKKQIEDIPNETEVFLRCCVNPCGNIVELKIAKKDTYGFFGEEIDCVILEPAIDEQFVAQRKEIK